MALDMPLSAKIEEYRAKQRAGTLTTQDMIEAIRLMRQGREAAKAQSLTRKRAEQANINSDALLDELGSLE